jgi:hypothetical protein
LEIDCDFDGDTVIVKTETCHLLACHNNGPTSDQSESAPEAFFAATTGPLAPTSDPSRLAASPLRTNAASLSKLYFLNFKVGTLLSYKKSSCSIVKPFISGTTKKTQATVTKEKAAQMNP